MAENENIPANSQNGPEMLVLRFADSKVPVFKEARNKDYIVYGEDNNYPQYLTLLFNKSAKHNAIITGKANYIFGNGYENGDKTINRVGDSLNDIAKKSILDIEIYGGFRWEIIWNRAGKIAEIYHVDYSCIRQKKDGGFLFKENWDKLNRDEPEDMAAFNPSKPVGSQIFAYNQYRPNVRYYPLPDYIGCNNYIETDIEISKFYLSSIRNGMMPSKMIQFFKGEPDDSKKAQIERRFSNKFSGSENAGRFLLVFNDANASKSVEINDLSGNELDKMFIELNKTVQQEIFSGHKVVSPMLFGIKTEGQLGGNGELKTSYEAFVNTYAKPRANDFDRELNWVMSYSIAPVKYELRQNDPIGLQFDVKDVINSLPKQFVFEKLGIPKDQWNLPNIGSDNKPGEIAPTEGNAPAAMVNDNIKNLTGRQLQGIQRIVRQYENPNNAMTRQQAVNMLKKGFGLDDEDIVAFLGEDAQPAQMSAITNPDEIVGMFDACGDDRGDYEIVKSKRVSFSELDEIEAHEQAFRSFNVSPSEKAIIDAVKLNPKVTVKEIADRTRTTETYIDTKLRGLINEGYLEGDIGSLLVPPRIIDIINTPPNSPSVQIFVKYSYEGPQDSRNRPFCAKMMQLNRLYSRADIEKISQRLGYSVFDRRGGFYRQPDGTTSPHCRHDWRSNIVVKKGGQSS